MFYLVVAPDDLSDGEVTKTTYTITSDGELVKVPVTAVTVDTVVSSQQSGTMALSVNGRITGRWLTEYPATMLIVTNRSQDEIDELIPPWGDDESWMKKKPAFNPRKFIPFVPPQMIYQQQQKLQAAEAKRQYRQGRQKWACSASKAIQERGRR